MLQRLGRSRAQYGVWVQEPRVEIGRRCRQPRQCCAQLAAAAVAARPLRVLGVHAGDAVRQVGREEEVIEGAHAIRQPAHACHASNTIEQVITTGYLEIKEPGFHPIT